MSILPRTLRRLNQNPLVAPERAALRGAFPRLLHWRYLPLHALLLAGVLAALLPLAVYLDRDHTRLLAAMGVIIFGAKLAITLRTLLLAAHTIARDSAPDRWQALITSGLDARQIVIGKWWAVVRQMWGWYLITGLMGAGLALGIAQQVYDIAYTSHYPDQYPDWSALISYPYPVPPALPHAGPGVIQVALVIVITLGLSVLQAGFVAALGLLGGMIARWRHVSPGFVAVIVYVLCEGLLIGVLGNINSSTADLKQQISYSSYYSYYSYYYVYNCYSLFEIITMTLAGTSFAAVVDGGILISADLLRPNGVSVHGLRCLTNTALGSGLYLVLILFGLRLAQGLIVKQGAPQAPKLIEGFIHWTHNPISRAQTAVMHRDYRHNRGLQVFGLAVFAAALAVTWLPRWQYIDGCSGSKIVLIAGAAYAAHILVVLFALTIAAHSVHRENGAVSWDVLALTGIDSRQFVLGKWWAVFRSVWVFLALAAMLKLGLAYGLAQYLHYRTILPPFTHLQLFFNYLSDHFVGSGMRCGSFFQTYNYYNLYNAPFEMLARLGVILLVFSLLEAAFLSALGILSALLVRKSSIFQLVLAVFLRILPIAAAILALQSNGLTGFRASSPDWTELEKANLYRVISTLQIAASTQMDGGIASVNLTSDAGRYSLFARARQYLALGLGAVGYMILIGLALWAAQKVAERRGLLPPPDDEAGAASSAPILVSNSGGRPGAITPPDTHSQREAG